MDILSVNIIFIDSFNKIEVIPEKDWNLLPCQISAKTKPLIWRIYTSVENLFYQQPFFLLHLKSFALPLFNPSHPYSTPIFEKDDVRLGYFVPSFHPETRFYSCVSLRKVCDQMAIMFPCFHFLLWPGAFVQTSVLSEFDMTSIICILKKTTLKAFDDLFIILNMYWVYVVPWEKHSIYVVPWEKKIIEGIIIFKF